MTQAIYETFVRMSQPFTNNVPEVDFHGANGNQILGGDSFAADRYSESRLAKITEQGMLKGIEKNNVDMIPNFSEDELWPKVLPAVFPRLLVNGSQGIGVSIANVWTLHNFKETADLIIDYLNTNKLNADNYYPDYPTGGTIINKDELSIINETGKGKVILQANYTIDDKTINFYEMPYQVYIEPTVEQIKNAIESEKIVNIKEVYNKSDKKHLSLEVVCDKIDNVEKVLAQLFRYTDLRTQINVNQVGMVGKTPSLKTLKETIDIYIDHNLECINREFTFDRQKTAERINILKGLLLANENIEDVINIIRNADNPSNKLIEAFDFNEEQVKAILDMRLAKLTKLESDKLKTELSEKQEYEKYCDTVIGSADKRKEILVKRLKELAENFSSERKTKVIQKDITEEKIKTAKHKKEPETVIVVVNKDGYIKSIPIKSYKSTDDEIMAVKTIDTDDLVRVYTNLGKVYRVQLKAIKKCSWKDKGMALGSILSFEQNEKVLAADCVLASPKCDYIAFACDNGMVKKTKLSLYDGMTRNYTGMKYINLKDNAVVIGVEYGKEDQCFSLTTKNDQRISFKAIDVSYSGKSSAGVKGIVLKEKDGVIKFDICDEKDFKVQKRGGKGVKVK